MDEEYKQTYQNKVFRMLDHHQINKRIHNKIFTHKHKDTLNIFLGNFVTSDYTIDLKDNEKPFPTQNNINKL